MIWRRECVEKALPGCTLFSNVGPMHGAFRWNHLNDNEPALMQKDAAGLALPDERGAAGGSSNG